MLLVGLLFVGAGSGWTPAGAGFTSLTQNAANGWSTGTVVLTGDAASAAFSRSGLTPRSASQSSCIRVTYTGTIAAQVRLYATTSGVLAEYVQLTVEEGDTGGNGDCTGFTTTGASFTGTLASFAATYDSAANGWGSFAAAGSGPNRFKVYRFTTSLRAGTPAYAQESSATATFSWQARNT